MKKLLLLLFLFGCTPRPPVNTNVLSSVDVLIGEDGEVVFTVTQQERRLVRLETILRGTDKYPFVDSLFNKYYHRLVLKDGSVIPDSVEPNGYFRVHSSLPGIKKAWDAAKVPLKNVLQQAMLDVLDTPAIVDSIKNDALENRLEIDHWNWGQKEIKEFLPLHFENVRESLLDSLRQDETRWKLDVDLPTEIPFLNLTFRQIAQRVDVPQKLKNWFVNNVLGKDGITLDDTLWNVAKDHKGKVSQLWIRHPLIQQKLKQSWLRRMNSAEVAEASVVKAKKKSDGVGILAINSSKVGTGDCAGSTCDYSSVGSAESSLQGDFVTATTTEKLVLYDDADFTESTILFDPSTTNSSYYWWLIPFAGDEHGGIEGGGVRFVYNAQRTVRLKDEAYIFEDFEVYNTGYTPFKASNTNANWAVIFRQMYFSDAGDHGIQADDGTGGTWTVENSFFADSVGSHRSIELTYSGGTLNLYNNTFLTTGTGIFQSAGTVTATNNAVFAATCFSGTITQSYNVSSDGTSSGTGSKQNKNAADNLVATGVTPNLHMKVSATDIEDAGTNLTGTWTEAEDIDGDTWPAAGDINIGADHTEAAAGAPVDRRRLVKIKIPKILKYID